MSSKPRRPFFRSKAADLRAYADGHWSDPSALKSVVAELSFRSTNAAHALEQRIARRIAELQAPAPLPVPASSIAPVTPARLPDRSSSPQVSVAPSTGSQVSRQQTVVAVGRDMDKAGQKESGIFAMIVVGSIVAFVGFFIFRAPAPKPTLDPFKANVIQDHDVHVDGYTNANGTYVQPHARTKQNHTRSDNFSTKGNINFYNGKRGTR